ncbi:MAG: hypothetical protein VYE22_21060 [Myxococcota bacterium]|nr:hypothetical protein [Myxococcota bacterium]
MGKVWLAVLLAALGLAPGRALAQGCGDDDSGSSDSCPVTWSYDDDDDSSGSSEEEVCVETSDVVGLQRCRRFGRGWDVTGVPALRLSLAGNARRARVGHLSFRGQAEHHNETHALGDAGRDLHDADLLTGGLTARLDLTIFDYLSVGGEVSFAGASVSGAPRTDGALVHTPTSVSFLGGGLVLGAGIPVDVFTIRPELFLGGRAVLLSSETRVGDCVESTLSDTAEWVVEPRIAVEWFVGPWTGLSVFVGTNVLVPGEVNAGVQLSLHARSYDAAPSR